MSLARCWGRVTNLTVTKALGSKVWDVDGAEYIDCTSGIAVTNVGHCHPQVVAAIQRQAEQFIHCQVNVHYSDTLLAYADRLKKHMPPGVDSFFFSNSGAEAVEGTCKLVRQATKRLNVLGMQGAFHGRTGTAMALTTSGAKYRAPFFPAAANVFSTQRPLRAGEVADCKAQLALLLKGTLTPETIAGVVQEPILGEGGFWRSPEGWLEHLRSVANDSGALLCYDEVQTGFGRCGSMFAYQQSCPETTKPDVVIFGKGIAGGLPMAGFAAKKDVMDALEPSMHGGTYGGNPIAAAAAIAVLDVLEEPSFLPTANERAKEVLDGLRALSGVYPGLVLEPRGTGFMIAFDMRTPEDAKALVDRLRTEHRILFFAPCGIEGRTLRVMPPLVITPTEVEQVLSALDSTLAYLSSKN
ncbi:hypothetical protein DIPPA_26313 [Diplonema papillatum]|nr:hypothetical protein DIPPA_26313 [Diplonema papillatum]